MSWLQYLLPVAAWSGWHTVPLFFCFQSVGQNVTCAHSNTIRRYGLAVTWNSESCSYFTALSLALGQVWNKRTCWTGPNSVLYRQFMSAKTEFLEATDKLEFPILRFRVPAEIKKSRFAFTAKWVFDSWNGTLNLCAQYLSLQAHCVERNTNIHRCLDSHLLALFSTIQNGCDTFDVHTDHWCVLWSRQVQVSVDSPVA